MSKTRRIYFLRLAGRLIVLLMFVLLMIYDREEFEILKGMNFFRGFSVLHVLWGIWMLDMVLQLIPVKAYISIGSQKVFQSLFRPIKEKVNRQSLKKHIVDTTKSAYVVMLVWVMLNIGVGILHLGGVIDSADVLLISSVFYVCDLVCVLIWCPFRLIMKNKCCTTCRIFNWDHLMMFSPLATVCGFYGWTLFGFSFVIFVVWEVCVLVYPERFWENSNMALKCSECTDKLCTQYCRKLRDK